MSLRKVRPYDPVRHSAAHHNAVVDLHHAQLAVGAPAPPQRHAPNATIFAIQNDTGDDLEEFAVVGIGDPLFASSAALDRYQYHPAFKGVAATAAHVGKFAVVQGPIKHDSGSPHIGYAVFAGITAVQLTIVDGDHKFAEVDPDNPTQLKTAVSGSARILHRDAGEADDVVWATVRLGDGIGGFGRIRGLTTSAVGPSATTITVDNIVLIAGEDPRNDPESTSETVTGHRTSGNWEADDNAEIRLEWVAGADDGEGGKGRWEVYYADIVCPGV